jgi:hypothetical protein
MSDEIAGQSRTLTRMGCHTLDRIVWSHDGTIMGHRFRLYKLIRANPLEWCVSFFLASRTYTPVSLTKFLSLCAIGVFYYCLAQNVLPGRFHGFAGPEAR